MGDKSKIEWTDATWNPIVGCSLASPGCTNCYAMRMAERLDRMMRPTHGTDFNPYYGLTKRVNGKPVWTGKVARAAELTLTAPLRWKRPRRIFVNSMGDLFHESIPDAWIDRVFAVMALCPQHTFQVLTKRSARMREYVTGLTIDRLESAAQRLEPRPKRVWGATMRTLRCARLNWIIVGGESGPGARPMHPDWARSIRDQCGAAGVPFFFKQWGKFAAVYDRDVEDPNWRRAKTVERGTPHGQWLNFAGGQGFHGERVIRIERVGKRRAGRLLDGVEHNALPERAAR